MVIELGELSVTIADTSKMVLDQLGTQLRSALAPLMGLFRALSSEKESPGDKLERRLSSMQAEISQLKAAEGRSLGAEFLGNVTPGTDLDTRNGPQQLHQLTETVVTMQASLQSMRDQLASELVRVSTVNFISRSFTKNWLSTEGSKAEISFFLDARSLLELIHDPHYSHVEAVNLDGKLKAAGHGSRDDALTVHSFEVELPAMFGKESSSGVTRDSRALPGIPTFKEWDAGGGIRGAKFNLATNLRKTDHLKEKIAMHLAGEAREVARQMLDDSVRFVQELSVWISTHYMRLRSGTSEEAGAHHPLRSHDFQCLGARSPVRPHLSG
jgi:hypothetical protein